MVACAAHFLHIAARLAEVSPDEAHPLLAGGLRGLARGSFPRDWHQLFDAWFAVLGATGQNESMEALEAAVLYLWKAERSTARGMNQEQRAVRVQMAGALLKKFGSAVPEETRGEAVRLLAREYFDTQRPLDVVALRKDHVGLVARQHGERSLQALKAHRPRLSTRTERARRCCGGCSDGEPVPFSCPQNLWGAILRARIRPRRGRNEG